MLTKFGKQFRGAARDANERPKPPAWRSQPATRRSSERKAAKT